MICRLLFLCTVLLWPFVSCNRLKRMEEKMKQFDLQQHHESISRLEDVSRLSDRLDSIQIQLNSSQAQCCSEGKSEDTKPYGHEPSESPNLRNAILTEAFKEEKQEHTRLRQKVSEIDDIVSDISGVLGSVKHEIDIASGAREQTEEKCQSNYVALSEKLDDAIKLFLDEIQTLKNSINSTRDDVEALRDRVHTIKNNTITDNGSTETPITRHQSCFSLFKDGFRENGAYSIYPTKENKPVEVYCDMTTDGGGWTVFQRRQDGSVDFYRDWDDYKQGFGDVSGEFWLGNDHIVALTSGSYHELRIELEAFDGGGRYAKYNKFQVLPESDRYKLIVDRYSGDAGDYLQYNNHMRFSTKDRDNDYVSSLNCAVEYNGGWWYKYCYYSNLNGLYLRGPSTTSGGGVIWYPLEGKFFSQKVSEMKLR